jgi:secreted trypsin-like serine protease
MREVLFTFVMLFLISCGRQMESVPENVIPGDIVNGERVTQKMIMSKAVVALMIKSKNGQSLCSGSLIAPQIILTAAHCVDDDPERINIIFAPSIKKGNTKTIRIADRILPHPLWHKHTAAGEGDLALVHFSASAPNEYKPIKIVSKNFNLTKDQQVLLAGYGVTDGLSHASPGILRQTESSVIDRHSETEVVLDGDESSVCFGDSGGPAFILQNNQLIQWGVASSVSNRACNDTAIHTELMRYLNWIKTSSEKLTS